jgi:hypothetical protein
MFLGCDQSDPFGPLFCRCRSKLPGRCFRNHRVGPVSVYEDSVVDTPFHVGDVAHMAAFDDSSLDTAKRLEDAGPYRQIARPS